MKKLLIVIAVGFAVVGGAAWAYAESDGARASGWAEPADYSYRVAYGIFGPGMGTYDITVRNHKVTAVERLADSDWPDAESWVTVENAWTLADLEAKYRAAKANPESDATITYDATTGAPSAIHLDWIVQAVDDEESFQVLAFDPVVPAPDAPAAWAEPADYAYRVAYSFGFMGPAAGTYDITVRDHEVVAVARVQESGLPDQPSVVTLDNAWTLADLEAKYLAAKANPESDATITYDPVTGAPATISLDWLVHGNDDEESFSVLAFDPVVFGPTE
jgi:hypothetical protein